MTSQEKQIKKVKDDLSEYEQSNPHQLDYFKITEQKEVEKYSNTIELYDQMPKYYFGGVEREKGKNVEALAILQRDFKHKGKNYVLEVVPAAILNKKGKTIHYYPSQREELVEDALRKLLANKRGVFLDKDVAVKFTLYELQQELQSRGHGYNINQIKEAIEICHKTTVDVLSKGGNQVEISATIFPFVAKENKSKGVGKEKYVVMFHPLVTKSINEKTYRLYDYKKVMTYKMNISRWIHKRMSHNYLQAHTEIPYKIKMSTIIRDSGMKSYKKKYDCIVQIEKSLTELQRHNTIDKFETKRELSGRKILDALFILYVSEEFVNDIKKANKITNRKLTSIHTKEYEENNIIIRDRLENISGLSLTIINNIILKLSDIDTQYAVLDSLDAAEDYIKKKGESSIEAAVVKSAINEGWIPKNRKNRLDKRKKLDDEGRFDETINISEDMSDINLLNYNTNLVKQEELRKLRSSPVNKKIFKILENNFDSKIYNDWIRGRIELLKIIEQGGNIEKIEFITKEKYERDWVIREYKEDMIQFLKKDIPSLISINISAS
jgi:hypothetical protein